MSNILIDMLFESIDLFTHLFMFDTFLTRRWSKSKSNFIIYGCYLLFVCYVDLFYFSFRNSVFINFLTIFCFVLYKNRFIQILGFSILVRLASLAVESLVIAMAVPLLKFRILIDIDDTFIFSSIIVLTRTSLILPLFILIRKIRNGYSLKDMVEKLSIKQSLLYSLAFLVYIVLTYISIWRTEKYQQISNYPLLLTFSIAVLGFLIMSCNCIYKIVKIKMKENQVAILSQQIRDQNEQALLHKKAEKDTKKIRHDLKNELLGILICVQRGKMEEVISRLEALLNNVVKTMPRTFSRNPAANSIFRRCHALASERGICMLIAANLPEEDFIPPEDLGTIIKESCNNAIEACEGMEHPTIEIKTRVNNHFWYYSIRNTVKSRVKIIDGYVPTTKRDKTSHGFGLSRIRSTAEKYRHGKMLLDSGEGYFKLTVSLRFEDKINE